MSQRIVSLVPSATEIVCAFGRRAQLVGRSHECDFPPDVASLPACTSARIASDASSAAINDQVKSLAAAAAPLYEVNAAQLAALRPDIILTQAQCDVCAVSPDDVAKAVAQIPGPPPKIISTGAVRIADLWKDMLTIAEAIGALDNDAREVISALKNRVVDVLQKTCAMTRRPSVACLEWLDPLMAAGNWIPELVDFAGGKNLFGEPGQHSPWMTWPELKDKNPDIIILMPCGFSLERARQEAAVLQRHPDWPRVRAVKSKNVFVTDGNQYFNRPGPRLVDSLEILTQIIWPKIFPPPQPHPAWSRL
jgi:iron complex transport system substrate-binding protein